MTNIIQYLPLKDQIQHFRPISTRFYNHTKCYNQQQLTQKSAILNHYVMKLNNKPFNDEDITIIENTFEDLIIYPAFLETFPYLVMRCYANVNQF
eukprot:154931_1